MVQILEPESGEDLAKAGWFCEPEGLHELRDGLSKNGLPVEKVRPDTLTRRSRNQNGEAGGAPWAPPGAVERIRGAAGVLSGGVFLRSATKSW